MSCASDSQNTKPRGGWASIVATTAGRAVIASLWLVSAAARLSLLPLVCTVKWYQLLHEFLILLGLGLVFMKSRLLVVIAIKPSSNGGFGEKLMDC